MNGIQIAIHAPLLGSPLGRGNCDKLPVSNATRGFLVFQLFRKVSTVMLVGVIALLVLAIACSAPDPTATPAPIPTPTVIPTATPAPSTGNWEQIEETDPIDDTTSIAIKLKASESALEFPNSSPVLQVMCATRPAGEDPIEAVAIGWGVYLGQENVKVDWRVDEHKAKSRHWGVVGDDGIVTFNQSWALKDLERADKITVRVHRDFSESLTAIWHVEGFAEAYKPVEEACKQ